MKILFVGSNNYPKGGAADIAATDVKMKSLQELLDAHSEGNDWWHVWDTTTRSTIKEGKFEKTNNDPCTYPDKCPYC